MKKWLRASECALLFQKELCLIGAGMMLAAYAFGMGLLAVLAAWDSETTAVFPLGSIMALIVLMVLCFWSGALVTTNYNYAIAMGQTRRRTMPAYALALFVFFFGFGAVTFLLYVLEVRLLGAWYPAMRIEAVFVPVYVPLLFAVGAAAFSMLLGAVVTRFGQKGYLVLYFTIFGMGLGLPNGYAYLETHAVHGVLLQALHRVCAWFLRDLPVTASASVLAGALLCLTAAFLMLRRQQVRV